MNYSILILTNSGGIQEEAPSLGKPVWGVQNMTERPERISAEATRLIGTTRGSIIQSVLELMDNVSICERMRRTANPFADGHASERIVQIIPGG
jgi:UDP-N-acetylglucosamine 2-epimerase (non-hydrolysing)